MKVITSVELSKGYEHWKELFLSNEDFRQKNQINVVAYGHEADNENKVGHFIRPKIKDKVTLRNGNLITG